MLIMCVCREKNGVITLSLGSRCPVTFLHPILQSLMDTDSSARVHVQRAVLPSATDQNRLLGPTGLHESPHFRQNWKERTSNNLMTRDTFGDSSKTTGEGL